MWLSRLWRRLRGHRLTRYPLLYKRPERSDDAGNLRPTTPRDSSDAGKQPKQDG